MRQLQRDPFARATFVRFTVPKVERQDGVTCRWCGSSPAKFRYAWDGDGLRSHALDNAYRNGRFCSVGCFRTFHEKG